MKYLMIVVAVLAFTNTAHAERTDRYNVKFNDCKQLANQLLALGGKTTLDYGSSWSGNRVYMTKVWMPDGEVSVQCFEESKRMSLFKN